MSETKKLVLIVPGRRERVDGKAYKKIGMLFESNSIVPKYIQPDWRLRSTSPLINDTLSKINKVIENSEERDVYGFGFSFGAMLLLMGTRDITMNTSILCSMSFFNEEIPQMGRLLKFFTKRITYNGEDPIAYPIIGRKQKAILLYGEKELSIIPKRIIKMRETHFSGETVIAKMAGHNLRHAGYQSALREVIGSINRNN